MEGAWVSASLLGRELPTVYEFVFWTLSVCKNQILLCLSSYTSWEFFVTAASTYPIHILVS